MPRKKKEIEEPVLRPIEVLPIGEATEQAILNAASYIDNQRALANVKDGCKPSYRRLIWSALQFPRGVMQPSVEVINKMASYHPHSLDSMKLLSASFVRTGIFSGTGSFGTTSILGDVKEPAAPRYTHMRLSDLYYDQIAPLLSCVDMVESPVGALEIDYCPLALPLCLSLKGLVSGIGVGISTVYPNFSPKSLYLAYKNNNPQLLEPNVDLIMDKNNSELESLWTTGKGRIIYSYKLSPYTNEDGKPGFLFEGDTCIFTPNLRKINKYVDQGQVFIEDMTDMNGPKMFVGLISNRGNLRIEDLEKLCRQCCFDATVYQLNVTDGTTCYRIPLYDWINYTYRRYIKLLERVNLEKIEKVKFEIKVQESLPEIANYIINVNPGATDKEICTNLGIEPEVVSTVMSKPIGQLRKNKDNTGKIKALKQRLKDLLVFDPELYVKNLIEKL